jgi:predicted nucleotidyltransferase
VLEKEGFIELVYEGNFSFYKLIVSRKMLNLKLYYNLEKIRESGLIEDLEKFYDFPVIILFGSYVSARDDILSDLDLCLISNVEKVFSFEKYEKIIRRKVELHKFTKSSWSKAKKLNPHLVNSICNGLVLSGELEVL